MEMIRDNHSYTSMGPLINPTLIGYDSERDNTKFSRLNRLNYPTMKQFREFGAWAEIGGILANLNILSKVLRTKTHKNYKKFWECLRYRSRDKGLEPLIPVSIYLTCQESFIVLKLKDLYPYCHPKKLRHCLTTVLTTYPKLSRKFNTKEYRMKTIDAYLLRTKIELHLSIEFLEDATELLLKYYESLKNTKLVVIAGRVLKKINDILFETRDKWISKSLGIQQSTLYWRAK